MVLRDELCDTKPAELVRQLCAAAAAARCPPARDLPICTTAATKQRNRYYSDAKNPVPRRPQQHGWVPGGDREGRAYERYAEAHPARPDLPVFIAPPAT